MSDVIVGVLHVSLGLTEAPPPGEPDDLPVPPHVSLLGRATDFRAKQGGLVSFVFRAVGMNKHNALPQLSVNLGDVELDLTDPRYSLSVRVIRIADGVNTSIIRVRFEITFTIAKVIKSDAGIYKLVARNEYGESEATFKLKVISMPHSVCMV